MKTNVGLIMGLVVLMLGPAWAEVHTQSVSYKDGEVVLEGHLAWDDTYQGKRPGILVVHEWWGLNEYAKWRAEELANMGYVAFALDMYGKGKVTTHPKEAGKWAGAIQKDLEQWQKRALAGLTVFKDQKQVDVNRLAAIGYCFGGATVMALAYSGADVKGVVSFHGSLPIPRPDQASQTRAKVFIAHGNADPFLQESHLRQFRNKMDEYGLDWHMAVYSGARHSFTNPKADQYGMEALQYNERADRRSWQHMQTFFEEIFR